MLKNFRDKVTFSGITVLLLGVALLVATFISAYLFLNQSISMLGSSDLVGIFGESLAPLIATVIRIMYLGVMGWIGSLLTIRGVTLILNAPKMEVAVPQKAIVQQPKPVPVPAPTAQKAKQEPQKEEPKPEAKPEPQPTPPAPQPEAPEAKPSEPEFIVIPPEEVAQPPPTSPPQKEQEQPPQQQQPQQNNNSPPPQQPSQ